MNFREKARLNFIKNEYPNLFEAIKDKSLNEQNEIIIEFNNRQAEKNKDYTNLFIKNINKQMDNLTENELTDIRKNLPALSIMIGKTKSLDQLKKVIEILGKDQNFTFKGSYHNPTPQEVLKDILVIEKNLKEKKMHYAKSTLNKITNGKVGLRSQINKLIDS